MCAVIPECEEEGALEGHMTYCYHQLPLRMGLGLEIVVKGEISLFCISLSVYSAVLLFSESRLLLSFDNVCN